MLTPRYVFWAKHLAVKGSKPRGVGLARVVRAIQDNDLGVKI